MITATDWRALVRNTLQGFLTLTLSPSGIVIREATLHEKDGKRWIGLPARPQVNKDGSPRLDPKTGKPAWQPIVEITGKPERERFQAAALAAVDKLLGGAP